MVVRFGILGMNVLNIKLQGRDQLINKLLEYVCTFEMKLHLWAGQFKQCNYAYFPTLSACQLNEATTYVAFVGYPREQFKTQFAYLRTNNQGLGLFATPFTVNMESVAIHLQMELTDLQCNTDLETKCKGVAIVKFYQ